ncbi:MAG: hypothetical protein L0I29_12975 [Hyphomicrobiales bacterium]|nr:hypothetical protein [Hyphomicrobiales bacterium]
MNTLAKSLPVPVYTPPAVRLDPVWWLGELGRREPVLAGVGILIGLAAIPMALAGALDPRFFNGIDVWIKPVKFATAIFLYMLTLAFFAGWVSREDGEKWWFSAAVRIVAAAALFEIVYISFQASLAQASHYNHADVLHIALYAMMGVGATLMVAFSGLLGVLVLRNRTLNVAPAIRDSVVIGLTLTFVLTMIVAGTLSAWGSHWIGGAHSDAGAMILTGWSRDGGDLRVAHLFATHAMHFIPIFGVASAYIFGARNRRPVWLFSALFTGFVAFLYFQALAGQPFLPFIE